jgi:hypothetical protein
VIILLALIAMLTPEWTQDGWLHPDQSVTYQWQTLDNIASRVQVEGHDGDVDCYLLRRNPTGHGWVIWQLDERPGSRCDFLIDKAPAEPLHLWVHNQGNKDSYVDVNVW